MSTTGAVWTYLYCQRCKHLFKSYFEYELPFEYRRRLFVDECARCALIMPAGFIRQEIIGDRSTTKSSDGHVFNE